MKRLFLILGALVIAAAIGVSMHRYPGVIIVALSPWRIDIPIWIGVLGFILLYLCFNWIVRLFSAILSAARSLAHFGRHYRKHRAKALMRKGFLALTEGNYSVAEKALVQSAEECEMPWYNYLCAAKAAQALGEEARAARYLARAQVLAPDSELAVSLAQAQFYLKNNQFEQAITELVHLEAKMPNHILVLEGLQKAYYAIHDWVRLSNLLPKLKKNQVLTQSNYQILEHEVWKNRLLASKDASLADIQTVWKNLPSSLHTDKDLVLIYVKCLIKNKQSLEAEPILRQAIKHEWDDALVKCYGKLSHPHPQKLLNTAEGWLHLHETNSSLLLSLGRLCVQQELWGKAQRYFEASLSLEPNPETYSELAMLLEKMNKSELSAQFFKKGLLLAAPVIAPMPYISMENE